MNGPALIPAIAAVGIATLQLLLTTGRTMACVPLLAIALASGLTQRRWRFGSAGEVLVLITLGVLASAVHGMSPQLLGNASAPLRSSMFVFAFMGLGMAALRLHLDRPEGGAPASLAAGGIVFLACGTVRTEGFFLPWLFGGYLACAFMVLALDAFRHGASPAPWQWRARRRHLAVVALMLVAVPVAMWGWGRTAPRVIRHVIETAIDAAWARDRVGFHDGPMTLHSLDGLLDSDAVVMRIEGGDSHKDPNAAYLRGNVYVDYRNGRWKPPEQDRAQRRSLHGTLTAEEALDSDMRIDYVGGRSDRFFLPLEAEIASLEPDRSSVDPWSIVRADESGPQMALLRRDGALALSAPAPGEADIGVPDELLEPLRRIAAFLAPAFDQDGAGISLEVRSRLLEGALQTRFEYSIDFAEAFEAAREANPDVDPILLFLEGFRRGHCEYFATALVLLLRAEGIPARLITGYRVSEHNPIGDYAIVRERHAHAWVEAHLVGQGWTRFDGTPISFSAGARTSLTPRFSGFVDWTFRALRRHGREILLGVLVTGLAGVQMMRLWRQRRPRKRRDARGHAPPRSLEGLLTRLAEAGFPREPGESLENVARRLRRIESGDLSLPVQVEPAILEAADLLERYSAHRYGDVGDWGELEPELVAWPGPMSDTRVSG